MQAYACNASFMHVSMAHLLVGIGDGQLVGQAARAVKVLALVVWPVPDLQPSSSQIMLQCEKCQCDHAEPPGHRCSMACAGAACVPRPCLGCLTLGPFPFPTPPRLLLHHWAMPHRGCVHATAAAGPSHIWTAWAAVVVAQPRRLGACAQVPWALPWYPPSS